MEKGNIQLKYCQNEMNRYGKILPLILATRMFTLTFQSIDSQTQIPHSDLILLLQQTVITITNDKDGNTIFNPQVTTIKQDEEILILNNDPVSRSFTNGASPEDPMAGKIFDSGEIQPKDSQNMQQLIYLQEIILSIQLPTQQ